MAEKRHGGESASANLGLRALLYASAALSAEDAAAFEEQLGSDQQACEALQEAVEFLQRWDAELPRQPDVSYRARVRTRLLRGGARVLSRLTTARQYRGHPLLWSAGGAVAAAVVVALALGGGPADSTAPPVRSVAEPRQAIPEAVAGQPNPMNEEELGLWADLPRSRHLLKVHHEESERKRRSELQMRIVLRTGMGGQVVANNGPSN